jgi:hypothetical protein
MALWGTKSGSEKKPVWQIDKDPTGTRGRPNANEERNTYAANTGWVRRIVKTLPDGTKRVIEELLVATNRVDAGSDAVDALPDKIGVANVTSVTFRPSGNIAANTKGYMDLTKNVHVDVSFNEAVDVNGTVSLQLSNSTLDFTINAYPAVAWDGFTSTPATSVTKGHSLTQNSTNLITFTARVSESLTGNGQIKITGTTLVAEDVLTDNVGGLSSNVTLDAIHADWAGVVNVPVTSTANVVILGSANTTDVP